MAGKFGLVFFPAFDWAITPTHPEREERLLYTRDQLFEEGVMDLPSIIEYKPRVAELKDIARVHFCVPNIKAQTTEAHLIAIGGTLVIADALINKEITNGFALVRPPGHHAMRVVHGNRGFCNVNNEAIMIEYLRKHYGIKKIAIVDTDVHHGDGTQEIFWHDPDVLAISFHQDGRTLYPGTGFIDEIGGPTAPVRTINIPLPPRTNDEGIHYVLDQLVIPILEEFRPEIIINSAGQDNHYTDPLANMSFSAQGYARLAEKLKAHIAVLEGGYAIQSALPYVNLAIVLAMAGLDYSGVREPDFRPEDHPLSTEHRRYISDLVSKLADMWEKRDSLRAAALAKAGQEYERYKRIFYDTDYIHEEQLEKLRICTECIGAYAVWSQATTGKSIAGISLPFGVCPKCRAWAEKEYNHAVQETKLDYVYWQDKERDEYRTREVQTGITTELGDMEA